MASSYYRKSQGAIICYSITDKESFYHWGEWMKRAKKHWLENCQYMLVGNKWDLEEEREIEYEEGENEAK